MSKAIIRNVKPRITILKKMPYKGIDVIVRMINKDLFEYLFSFKNEIYSTYIIVTPGKNKTALSKGEINQAVAVIFTGALTTIDYLLGDTPDKQMVKKAKEFMGIAKNIN